MTDKKTNKIIVILGMHRSGTSALTRGLLTMGVRLGDSLVRSFDVCNPKGFWEDVEINDLNIEMLNALGREWYHAAEVEASDVKTLLQGGFLPRAVEMLRRKTGGAAIFGFKDPRMAKMLPFWKEAFRQCGLEPCYLLAIRHPFSVSSSLAARDGFEPGRSYLLWLGHVLPSLTGSAGARRVIVDYDRLLQSPEMELSRVARGNGLELDPVEMTAYKQEFLDRGLRHTKYELEELRSDPCCPPLVREVYMALLELASDRMPIDGPEFQEKLVRWSEEFQRLKPVLLLLDRFVERELAAARIACERQALLTHLDDVVAHQNQNLAAHKEQALWFTQALAEREAQLAELKNSRTWRLTRPLRLAVQLLRRARGLNEPAPPASQVSAGAAAQGAAPGDLAACPPEAPLAQAPTTRSAEHFDEHDYAEWLRRLDSLTGESRAIIRARIDAFRHRPSAHASGAQPNE